MPKDLTKPLGVIVAALLLSAVVILPFVVKDVLGDFGATGEPKPPHPESPPGAVPAGLDCNGATAQRTAGASFQPSIVVTGFFAQQGARTPMALHRAIVADLAGVDPFADDLPNVAGITLRQPRVHRLLPPVERPPLDHRRQRPLEAALAMPTVQGFIAAAKQDPALMRQRWRHFDLATLLREDSALAHALRARGSALLPRIHEIPAAAFGLHELAVAIEQGIDVADFIHLLDRSGVDATSTWKHYTLTRRYNLTVVAAAHARPRILGALVARGVALPSGMPSALDELALALPTTQPAPDALANVAGQLAALGERPYLPSTAARLAALAPGITVPELHPDAETVLAAPEVRERAERLTALVARAKADAEEAQRISELCRDAWLAGPAGGTNDLAAKMAQHEAMRDREQHSLRENMEGAHRMAASLSPEFAESMDAMKTALKAGDWEGVLSLVDHIPMDVPDELQAEIPKFLLKVALDTGAPLGVVRQLIDRNGGVVPPGLILTLVKSDRDDIVQVAADLEALGLDPGFVDADGRNAINHLMDHFRARIANQPRPGKVVGWLGYLAGRSVSPQPAGRGLDPLDTVLFALHEQPAPDAVADAVLLARALVDVGAKVQSSHREISARIRASAPDAYAELIEAIPELAAAGKAT